MVGVVVGPTTGPTMGHPRVGTGASWPPQGCGADSRIETFLPLGHRARTSAQTGAAKGRGRVCAVRHPSLRTKRSGSLGWTAQPHGTTRLRTMLDRLRSHVAKSGGAPRTGAS